MQLLHARRFAFLLADLAEGALLLDEATWQLARDGDARKAVVAHAVRARSGSHRRAPAASSTTTAPSLDLFEPIVRYGADRPGRAPPRRDAERADRRRRCGASRPRSSRALDEQLGPPVDGYVNGTQTWLTDDGPGGATLEWRLHPVAGYRPPDGVGPTTCGTRSSARSRPGADPDALPLGDERRPLASLWDGLECFPAYGDEIEPAPLAARRDRARSASPPDAVGLVDHERIGERVGAGRAARSRSSTMLLDELATADDRRERA